MTEQNIKSSSLAEKKIVNAHKPLPNPPPPKKVLIFVAALMITVGLLCFLVSGI